MYIHMIRHSIKTLEDFIFSSFSTASSGIYLYLLNVHLFKGQTVNRIHCSQFARSAQLIRVAAIRVARRVAIIVCIGGMNV